MRTRRPAASPWIVYAGMAVLICIACTVPGDVFAAPPNRVVTFGVSLHGNHDGEAIRFAWGTEVTFFPNWSDLRSRHGGIVLGAVHLPKTCRPQRCQQSRLDLYLEGEVAWLIDGVLGAGVGIGPRMAMNDVESRYGLQITGFVAFIPIPFVRSLFWFDGGEGAEAGIMLKGPVHMTEWPSYGW